jgi:hypothetical protein
MSKQNDKDMSAVSPVKEISRDPWEVARFV